MPLELPGILEIYQYFRGILKGYMTDLKRKEGKKRNQKAIRVLNQALATVLEQFETPNGTQNVISGLGGDPNQKLKVPEEADKVKKEPEEGKTEKEEDKKEEQKVKEEISKKDIEQKEIGKLDNKHELWKDDDSDDSIDLPKKKRLKLPSELLEI